MIIIFPSTKVQRTKAKISFALLGYQKKKRNRSFGLLSITRLLAIECWLVGHKLITIIIQIYKYNNNKQMSSANNSNIFPLPTHIVDNCKIYNHRIRYHDIRYHINIL